MTVPTTSVDFGRVGAGMSSENRVITVVNTGAKSAKVSAMMLGDSGGFYNESLRLNGWGIGGFSSIVPSDTSDLCDKKLHHKLPLWLPPSFGAILLRNARMVTPAH